MTSDDAARRYAAALNAGGVDAGAAENLASLFLVALLTAENEGQSLDDLEPTLAELERALA